MTPEGIVGRVITTTAFSSEVELLTDVNAAAGAIVGEQRFEGVVQGTGGDLVNLNFIPASTQLTVGDEVQTSGTDGVYPKGLPIGEVAQVQHDSAVYLTVRVKPGVDFARLEEVAVILDEP